MKTSSLELLTSFRQYIYELLNRCRHALFDLIDALLTTGPMLSLLSSFLLLGWTTGCNELSMSLDCPDQLAHDSWAAPQKIRRLKPTDNINYVAVEQIKELFQDYPEDAPLLIFVFDAG